MDGSVIRDATTDDVPVLRDVFRRASLSNPGDRAALLAHPELLEWSPSAELATRVAFVDGRIAGFVSTVEGDHVLELEDLFVDPDEMRRGVGRALLADVIARGAAGGAAAIEVNANAHALAFYERVGFVVVGSAMTQFAEVPRMRLDLPGLASPR